MAKKSKQEIEQYYFEMFRRDYQLPEGTVTYEDKPDVILKGKRKIGIEITNFFLESGVLPESEQVQRKRREAVISESHKIYLANSGKKIELSFSFEKLSPIRNKKKLTNKIYALAKKIDGFESGEVRRDFYKDIPELSFVYLNAKEYTNPKWRISQCYSGQFMSMEKLHTIVKTKEAKSKYYQYCDAYWLVVVVDFIDSAQDQEIQINNFEKIASTVFEKVIVYRTFFGHVLEAK